MLILGPYFLFKHKNTIKFNMFTQISKYSKNSLLYLRNFHTKNLNLDPVYNLAPKLQPLSPITPSIKKEIDSVLMNPLKIPSILGNNYYNEITDSQYYGEKLVCHYNRVNENKIINYNNNYQENKEIRNKYQLQDRLDIFLDAADRLENEYYNKMIAYTIVGQNKTPYEAELDSICELVDFLRFNVAYIYELNRKQPLTNIKENYRGKVYNIKNSSKYLPLNGFVASITPFNFTAIGGNLALTPLMLGNVVFWKPSDNSILSNYLIYKILEESGIPKGILNFVPYDGPKFLDLVTRHKDLSGLIFTGSSKVFDNIYKKIGNNISQYRNYPRLIGETGGKNYHFIHTSMSDNIKYIAGKTFESAFGYSGQKCSACSRLYLPKNMLDEFLIELEKNINKYMSVHRNNYGVISKDSWIKSKQIIENIKTDKYLDTKIVIGGNFEKENFFIEPTVIVSDNKTSNLFRNEFFAPILTIYPYKDNEIDETIDLCRDSTNYALTGAIFTRDKEFIKKFNDKMKYSCGNYYINDKSTGSVVGQQPFGGSGKSGPNDKAGDINFIYRLTNQQNIKECVL